MVPTPVPSRSVRVLRGLWKLLLSGGLNAWRALRLAWGVARLAPTYVDGEVLLVPGYRLQYDEVPQAYSRRLKRALRLWHPGHRLLISGHSHRPGDQTEALAGYAYLRDLGLPAAADAILDCRARHTEENLQRAAAIVGDEATVVVISNRWHLARCLLLAQQLGLRWRVCAAERRWRLDPFAAVALLRETVAMLCLVDAAALQQEPRHLLDLNR